MTTPTSSESRADALGREDLVGFISAALACTGQAEFYGDAAGQAVSIDFYHQYMLGNYRRMYAHCLAAGVNDFNRATIIVNLLLTAAQVPGPARAEEGRLIAAALRELPPNRVYRLFERLVDLRLNNRRIRRIVCDYLDGRREPELHAIKYRRRLAKIVAHFHLRRGPEESALLFRLAGVRRFTTPLFESFRRARYDERAIYELPYTVAEGLAARKGIPRERFLARIAPRLTTRERLRLQSLGREREIEAIAEQDLSRHSLTRLAIYFLSLSPAQRRLQFSAFDQAMRAAAARLVRRAGLRLQKVAVVLDNSYSASGSPAKRDRPLALALACRFVLEQATDQLSVRWTSPPGSLCDLKAVGHTDLATPVLEMLAEAPSLLVLVSDGYDNDPPGGAAEIVRVFRERLDPNHAITLVHFNPVYDAGEYALQGIHPAMVTLGIRDAEGLPTLLGFARFVDGSAGLTELQALLEARAHELIGEEPRA
ncbi:MAG: hypothetical protein R6X02_21035 [Enhygromyxa sp.]